MNDFVKNNYSKFEYDSIVPSKLSENKVYDINEVIQDAKSKRNLMECRFG